MENIRDKNNFSQEEEYGDADVWTDEMEEEAKDAEFLSTVNHTTVDDAPGKFKVNNRWLFLTYSKVDTKYTKFGDVTEEEEPKKRLSDYTDEKGLRSEFEKKCRMACKPKKAGNEITQFICALEYHKNGIPHFHVAVSYATAHQTASSKYYDVKIDEKTFHPYIVRIKKFVDFNKVCQYISKEDKIVQKKESNDRSRILKQIWNCKSLGEAYVIAGGTSSGLKIHEIKLLWEEREHDNIESNYVLPDFGWYKTIYPIIEADDHRNVYWFCDRIGNVGKSALCYHLALEKKAVIIKCVGRMSDFAYIMKDEIDKGWDQKTLIIDIPRNYQDRKSVYEALECIKDGIFTSTKYAGKNVIMKRKPTTIVMANWWPHFTSMSVDRWKCFYINSRDECVKIPVTQAMRDYKTHPDGYGSECIEGPDGVCSM